MNNGWNENKIKRAIFSADNLENIVQFAIDLGKMGWHIIATKETVKELRKNNISAQDAGIFTGVTLDYGIPPTLHPKIEAALTQDVPYRIDLVYDIPYPHRKGNDVGGHTLLALGAKGGRIVTSNSADMQMVINELKKDPQHLRISAGCLQRLIDKAYFCTAEHYLTLACRKGNSDYDGLTGKILLELAGGENPYQAPAHLFISDSLDKLSLGEFKLCGGNRYPCFTNLADLDSILHTLSIAAEAFCLNCGKVPYIAIAAKHGNPCGMGIDWSSSERALSKALFGNPRAIWGGECVTNFKITGPLGAILYKSKRRKELYANACWMLDVIAAPDFDKKACALLSKNPARKLLRNPSLYTPGLPGFSWRYRNVRGGFLRQPPYSYVLDISKAKCFNRQKIAQDIDSIIIAWCVAYTSMHGGNETAIAGNSQLMGAGGGPSTVEAVNAAILRAKSNMHDTVNSVFAANAFFPFIDALEVLKKAGCLSGVFPAGGKNEIPVKKYFKTNKIATACLPGHYRGFCRH